MGYVGVSKSHQALSNYADLKFMVLAISKKDDENQNSSPELNDKLNKIRHAIDNEVNYIEPGSDLKKFKQKLITDIAFEVCECKFDIGALDVVKIIFSLGVYALYILHQKNKNEGFVKDIINDHVLEEHDMEILINESVEFLEKKFGRSNKEAKKEVYDYYKSALSGEYKLVFGEDNFHCVLQKEALEYVQKCYSSDPDFFFEGTRGERMHFVKEEIKEIYNRDCSSEEKINYFGKLIYDLYSRKKILQNSPSIIQVNCELAELQKSLKEYAGIQKFNDINDRFEKIIKDLKKNLINVKENGIQLLNKKYLHVDVKKDEVKNNNDVKNETSQVAKNSKIFFGADALDDISKAAIKDHIKNRINNEIKSDETEACSALLTKDKQVMDILEKIPHVYPHTLDNLGSTCFLNAFLIETFCLMCEKYPGIDSLQEALKIDLRKCNAGQKEFMEGLDKLIIKMHKKEEISKDELRNFYDILFDHQITKAKVRYTTIDAPNRINEFLNKIINEASSSEDEIFIQRYGEGGCLNEETIQFYPDKIWVDKRDRKFCEANPFFYTEGDFKGNVAIHSDLNLNNIKDQKMNLIFGKKEIDIGSPIAYQLMNLRQNNDAKSPFLKKAMEDANLNNMKDFKFSMPIYEYGENEKFPESVARSAEVKAHFFALIQSAHYQTATRLFDNVFLINSDNQVYLIDLDEDKTNDYVVETSHFRSNIESKMIFDIKNIEISADDSKKIFHERFIAASRMRADVFFDKRQTQVEVKNNIFPLFEAMYSFYRKYPDLIPSQNVREIQFELDEMIKREGAWDFISDKEKDEFFQKHGLIIATEFASKDLITADFQI